MATADREDDVAKRLDVFLADHASRTAEIQFRTDVQNRLLRLHVTALTAIFGVALARHQVDWLILLVPFESSLFGLWYVTHGAVILNIGDYIRVNIAHQVNGIFKQEMFDGSSVDPNCLMCWENYYAAQHRRVTKRSFLVLRMSTFFVPALLCALASLILALGAWAWDWAFYDGAEWAAGLVGLGGLLFSLAYAVLDRRWSSYWD